jgi:hypothetical protein
MTDDPRIAELAQFSYEKELTPGYGDTYLFFVGRDNVHGILKYLISIELLYLKFSMFGYDDDELNAIIMKKMSSENIAVQASIDKRQAGGVHERRLLAHNETLDPVAYHNSFVITSSPTGEILHTKGGVCMGFGVGFEGSTNWSASGEGIDMKKAQSNTLLVTTNHVLIARFTANLDLEHAAGLARMRAMNA